MDTLSNLKITIETLNTDQLRNLADWLAAHRLSRWDEEIDTDMDAGRFDPLMEELQEEFKQGKTTPL